MLRNSLVQKPNSTGIWNDGHILLPRFSNTWCIMLYITGRIAFQSSDRGKKQQRMDVVLIIFQPPKTKLNSPKYTPFMSIYTVNSCIIRTTQSLYLRLSSEYTNDSSHDDGIPFLPSHRTYVMREIAGFVYRSISVCFSGINLWNKIVWTFLVLSFCRYVCLSVCLSVGQRRNTLDPLDRPCRHRKDQLPGPLIEVCAGGGGSRQDPGFARCFSPTTRRTKQEYIQTTNTLDTILTR